jgi:hypothetical protein
MKTYKGSGTIELYDDHLVIQPRGLLAKGRPKEIPLGAIENVVLKPPAGLVDGYLQLQLGDDLGPPKPYSTDPNSLQYSRKQAAEFAELAELLRRQIAENRDSGILPVSITGVSFAGVTLRDGRIDSPQGGGPVAGAHAQVDTVGALSSRITATRLILTGPLALAWRKKVDNRELYLLIEGQGWAISVPVDATKGAQARAFVAKINAVASSLTADSTSAPSDAAQSTLATSSPEPSVPDSGDVFERIRKLGELRDAGLLTPEEFDAKKTDLLKRV